LRTAIILSPRGLDDYKRDGSKENPERDHQVIKGNSRIVIDTPGLPNSMQGVTNYTVYFVAAEYNKKTDTYHGVVTYALQMIVKNGGVDRQNSSFGRVSEQDFLKAVGSDVPKKNGQKCITCLLQRN